MLSLRTLIPAGTVALALCAPGVAAAEPTFTRTTYDVRVEASGAYHFLDDWNGGNGSTFHREVKSDWDVDSTIRDYEFIDGIPTGRFEGNMEPSAVVGMTDHTEEIVTPGDAPTVTDCKVDGLRKLYGPAMERRGRADGLQRFSLLVEQELVVRQGCTSSDQRPFQYELDLGEGQEALVSDFAIPAGGPGGGLRVDVESRDGAKCPYDRWDIDLCESYWRGVVTFTKTGETLIDAEGNPVTPPAPAADPQSQSQPQPQPQPQSQPNAPEPPAPAPPAGDEEEAVSARLLGGGSRALVTVRCAAACAGEVRAYPAGRRRGAKGRALTKARFSLPGAGDRGVRVRFDRAARARIRRAGGVRLEVVTRPKDGGAPQRETISLPAKRKG